MLRTSILSILLLAPAIWTIPIVASGTADSMASASGFGSEAVATASAVAGTAPSSATASATSSVSTLPLSPNEYGGFEIAPAVQNAQTAQNLGLAPGYQTYQKLPVAQQELPTYGYGGEYGRGLGGFGLAGGAFGGFGRYRESYSFRSRGFGGGLGGFGRYGFGGRHFKTHYSSGGVAAGGLGGVGGGFIAGGGAALLG